MDEKNLKQRLVQESLLSEAQLQTALEYQESIGGKITEIIIKLGFVSEAELNQLIARCEHMHTVELAGRTIDEELMAKISRKVIEQHEVLPFRQSDNTILLATSEPMDFAAVEEIQFLTNCVIETALARRSQIRELIARFYATHPAIDPAPEESQEQVAQRLLDQIADPTVAALARTLVRNGVVDIEAWESELKKTR